MRVHWTGRAKARLRLIHDYIAEDSPQSALQVVDRVTARSQQLEELPRSGRQVPEYNHMDVRVAGKALPDYLHHQAQSNRCVNHNALSAGVAAGH